MLLEDFRMEREEFPFGVEGCASQLYFPEDFPDGQKLKYHLHRTTLQKVLRMCAVKFNDVPNAKEQAEFLEILLYVVEQVADYELKMECIGIMRLLFVNFTAQSDWEAYLCHVGQYVSTRRANEMRKAWPLMKASGVPVANWSFESAVAFFFEIGKFQRLFDRKLDSRSPDSYDNGGAKLFDNRVLKAYLAFLMELLLTRRQGLNSLRALWEGGSAVKVVRRILLVVSKLPTAKPYLRLLYRMVFHLFGHSHEALLTLLFEDQVVRQYSPDECHPTVTPIEPDSQSQRSNTDGEELLLLALKMLAVGKATCS